MTIRKNTAFAVIGTVAGFQVGLYLLFVFFIKNSFFELEKREADANILRLRNAVEEQFNSLNSKILDWGAWDNAQNWLLGKDPKWTLDDVCDDSGTNAKLDFAIYYNRERKLAGKCGWDHENKIRRDLPADINDFLKTKSRWNTFRSTKDVHRGFVTFPSIGPAYVLVHPVVSFKYEGPIGGYVVFVKALGGIELKRLSDVTNLKISFKRLGEISPKDKSWQPAVALSPKNVSITKIESKSKLHAYTLFADGDGRYDYVFRIDFSRPIFAAGSKALNIFLGSATFFGIIFIFILLFTLEKTVLGRLLHLTKSIERIERSGNDGMKVPVEGRDEITYLSDRINEMLDSIAEKSRAITSIMGNIRFGLFRTDNQGRILKGYSASTPILLGKDPEFDMASMTIWKALSLPDRDAGNFEFFYSQIFESEFDAQVSAEQLPTRFHLGRTSLELRPSVIYHDDSQKVDSVLFSMADISQLADAQHQNEINITLLRILKHKDLFVSLLMRINFESEAFKTACRSNPRKHEQLLIEAKRSLHTWKGDLSTYGFGLNEITSAIHEIEGKVTSVRELEDALVHLHQVIQKFLNENVQTLAISDQSLKGELLHVEHSDILLLVTNASQAIDQQSTLDAINQFVVRASTLPAVKFFGNMIESAQEAGRRLGKKIVVTVEGSDTRLPHEYISVYQSLAHIMWNAVDHGFELPGERGEKSEICSLHFKFVQSEKGYRIEISDDGRGINEEKLLARAVAKGLVNEDLDPGKRANLIFLPGLSSADSVSRMSGRGIGLDAVKSLIERYDGSIRVLSRRRLGTKFIIELPAIKTKTLIPSAVSSSHGN